MNRTNHRERLSRICGSGLSERTPDRWGFTHELDLGAVHGAPHDEAMYLLAKAGIDHRIEANTARIIFAADDLIPA
jgi:hypothetical protein